MMTIAALRQALRNLGDYTWYFGFYDDPDYLAVLAALDELEALRLHPHHRQDRMQAILAMMRQGMLDTGHGTVQVLEIMVEIAAEWDALVARTHPQTEKIDEQ